MSDKIKKLSDAIRLGATFRPQGFGAKSMRIGDSCALGAAAEAAGLDRDSYSEDIYQTLQQRFPILGPSNTKYCHICNECNFNKFYEYIYHLNDSHRWTREQIADWLEAQGL